MEAIVLIEVLKFAAQAYFIAAKQAGATAEQAKAVFDETYPKFMDESAKPVDPVNVD